MICSDATMRDEARMYGPEYHRMVRKSWGVEACCCVGPKNGEPECPCKMRHLGIFQRDGRWVRPAEPECDLGPADPPCNTPEGT